MANLQPERNKIAKSDAAQECGYSPKATGFMIHKLNILISSLKLFE